MKTPLSIIATVLKITLITTSMIAGPIFQAHASDFLCRELISGRFIPSDQIKHQTHFNGENGTAGLVSGIYDNEQVMLKWRDTADFEEYIRREAHWLRWLNQRGIGVRFHGFSEINGSPAMVMTRVTEKNIILKEPSHVPELIEADISSIRARGLHVTDETIAELNRVIDLLAQHQIMPYDLQFLLTESGKLVLIDPEHFKLHKPTDYFTPPQISENLRTSFQSVLLPLRQETAAHD